MKPSKLDLTFSVTCIKCGEPIRIEFDMDGDPIGNVIASSFIHSSLFDQTCTPLNQGFMHMFCQHA